MIDCARYPKCFDSGHLGSVGAAGSELRPLVGASRAGFTAVRYRDSALLCIPAVSLRTTSSLFRLHRAYHFLTLGVIFGNLRNVDLRCLPNATLDAFVVQRELMLKIASE